MPFKVTIMTTVGFLAEFFLAITISVMILRYTLLYLFFDVRIPPGAQLPPGPRGMNLTPKKTFTHP